MTIRIIIADDESLMRSGLRLLLGAAPDIDIVAEAANGEEAIALTREFTPDLVLMDLRMPVMDGLEATRTLMAQAAHPEVLVLTAFGTDDFVLRALSAGATGYLLKDTPPDELIHAVRAAAGGTRTLSPGVVDSLLDRSGTTGSTAGLTWGDGGREDRDPLAVLTARERQIAAAVAQGMTNAQVARSLFVSTATVKTHLLHIYAKLGVNDRAAAVAVAISQGYVVLEDDA